MDNATRLKIALDPALLFEELMGFPGDSWQVQGLRSTAKRQAWLVGRQLWQKHMCRNEGASQGLLYAGQRGLNHCARREASAFAVR